MRKSFSRPFSARPGIPDSITFHLSPSSDRCHGSLREGVLALMARRTNRQCAPQLFLATYASRTYSTAHIPQIAVLLLQTLLCGACNPNFFPTLYIHALHAARYIALVYYGDMAKRSFAIPSSFATAYLHF